MSEYALLVHPSANRVYGQAAAGLACAELRAVLGVEAVTGSVGGATAVLFSSAGAPDGVGRLSSAFALFERVEDVEGGLLRPVALERGERFDDDLVTIQRYTGKTNEQFTRLLLNVAAAAAGGAGAVRWVLDPVAGRGTTLNQALLLGYSAAGVEADGKAVDAYEAFLRTWLQDKRIKHRFTKARVRREGGGKVVGRRFDVAVDGSLEVTMVHDDTRFAASHFKRSSFDCVVADLPYGVQHSADRSRSPAALVADSLGGWVSLVRPGGSLCLAVNVRTLSRDMLCALLADAGLRVLEDGGFEHRVDHAIQRDVVVAVRASRDLRVNC